MSNTSLGKGCKGSKLCIQQCINKTSLRKQIEKEIGKGQINWISPLQNENFKEYQLDKIIKNKIDWKRYWPRRQPQWDAIGIAANDTYIIIEAKAHVGEIKSRCSASEKSFPLINKTIKETFRTSNTKILMKKYYQVANRFAFLKILNDNNINAFLVFVYFVNDKTYKPTSKNEFLEAIKKFNEEIKLPSTFDKKYKIILFEM